MCVSCVRSLEDLGKLGRFGSTKSREDRAVDETDVLDLLAQSMIYLKSCHMEQLYRPEKCAEIRLESFRDHGLFTSPLNQKYNDKIVRKFALCLVQKVLTVC